jgi:hypothetical protein
LKQRIAASQKKSFHVSNEFVRHTQLQLRSNLSSTKEPLHSSTFVGLIDADKEMLAKSGEAWDIKFLQLQLMLMRLSLLSTLIFSDNNDSHVWRSIMGFTCACAIKHSTAAILPWLIVLIGS